MFFYVADVLRQVIENGGIKPQKKVRHIPFVLPIEERMRFEYSETPIPVSEIAKRLNALTDEAMKPISYRAIREWLSSLGMLEDTLDAEGKTTKRPTQRGESMGISLETRTGRNGPYFVVVYTSVAQHFILDNLDAVIEFNIVKKEKTEYCLLTVSILVSKISEYCCVLYGCLEIRNLFGWDYVACIELFGE